MKRKINLTENDLHKIINESVKRVLCELDWRTYASASDKAYKLGSSLGDKPFEKQRRDNQFQDFSDATSKNKLRQYRLPKDVYTYDKDDIYDMSQGELKRAQKWMDDVDDFNNNRIEYVKGQGWRKKQ